MINNNNIYKLIKKAKDENIITNNPILKIIQHPITFVYSFTLNAQNEPIFEEKNDISLKVENKKENLLKNNNDKNKGKQNNDINMSQKNINNNINKYDDKIKKVNDKEKMFLNKKRKLEIKQKNEIIKPEKNINNSSSQIIKNKIIHQMYNSKNINLWEDEATDEKNGNILPIHKQIEFLNKCKNEFNKHIVEKKSEYDKDLDKGRIKKVHKNKISFKKHKNYFQKISNKQLKNQFKFSNKNNNK